MRIRLPAKICSIFVIMLSCLPTAGQTELTPAREDTKMNEKANVGYAEISSDGILTLNLIGIIDGGFPVRGFKIYKPGDPYYEEVKRYIGDIKPGERKAVAPWPDAPR